MLLKSILASEGNSNHKRKQNCIYFTLNNDTFQQDFLT